MRKPPAGNSWFAAGCLAAALAILSLSDLPALQGGGRPDGARIGAHGPNGPNGPNGPDDPMREEIQETIEIYMIARMKRTLNLTDQQERIVIPLIEDLNASRREIHRGRRLGLMKLRPLVEEEASPDQEIAALVARLDKEDRQFRDREFKTRERIQAALNPRQQGQFILFMERFRQEMEDRLRRLQQDAGPGAGPGPEGGRRNPPPPAWQRPHR